MYVPDQVSRGRSGLDVSTYNEVRAGVKPPSALANAFRQSDEVNWTVFRFGPRFGTAFPDQQSPMDAAGELARQALPDFNATLPTPNPNFKAMTNLAARSRPSRRSRSWRSLAIISTCRLGCSISRGRAPMTTARRSSRG